MFLKTNRTAPFSFLDSASKPRAKRGVIAWLILANIGVLVWLSAVLTLPNAHEEGSSALYPWLYAASIVNAVAVLVATLVALRLLTPWHQVQQLLRLRAPPVLAVSPTPPSIGELLFELHSMVHRAIDNERRNTLLTMQLNEARTQLHTFRKTMQVAQQAHAHVHTCYQTILSYAEHLEESVLRKKSDPTLRDAYDDVCEDAHHLHVLMQGLSSAEAAMISATQRHIPPSQTLVIGGLMADILLSAAGSLERRNMKLSSDCFEDGIAVQVAREPVTHMLWLITLAMIRHGAEESTLALTCTRSPAGNTAMLAFVVTRLCPSTIAPQSRLEFLRERESGDVHLFAHALAEHPNMLLAALLAEQQGVDLEIQPISPYRCALTLYLPLARE